MGSRMQLTMGITGFIRERSKQGARAGRNKRRPKRFLVTFFFSKRRFVLGMNIFFLTSLAKEFIYESHCDPDRIVDFTFRENQPMKNATKKAATKKAAAKKAPAKKKK